MIKEVFSYIRYAYDLVALRLYNGFNFVMDLIIPSWMPQDSREIAQEWLKDLFKAVISGGADYAEAEVNPVLLALAMVLGWFVVGVRRAFRWVFYKGE